MGSERQRQPGDWRERGGCSAVEGVVIHRV
jgi:hypothetical protein